MSQIQHSSTVGVYVENMEAPDFDNGFFETMENLSPREGLSITQAQAILQARPVTRRFVARTKEGRVVGAILLVIWRRLARNGRTVVMIEDVVTHKDFEGQGIGNALMQKARQVASAIENAELRLMCSSDLVEYYEQFGFKTTDLAMKCKP